MLDGSLPKCRSQADAVGLSAKSPNYLKMVSEPSEPGCEGQRRCRQHYSRARLGELLRCHEGDDVFDPIARNAYNAFHHCFFMAKTYTHKLHQRELSF
jgi:hypothetical protein